MRSWALFICVCLLISSCKCLRYENKYKANLKGFSQLDNRIVNPQYFGDSIEQKLNQSIINTRQTIYSNTVISLAIATVGEVFAIIFPSLPLVKNKKIALGISVASDLASALELLESIGEPVAYCKRASKIVSAWDNSNHDNSSLIVLRASYLSLQETWPIYSTK